MKYLQYLFVILFIPFIVLAEECDISKITITAIEQSSIEGNTEEKNTPTIQDKNINLDIKMYEIGDSITYDLTINNASEENIVREYEEPLLNLERIGGAPSYILLLYLLSKQSDLKIDNSTIFNVIN